MTKILIVEDDTFLSELLSSKFIRSGYTISVAKNGEEGVQKAVDEKPNLILLDLILPKMSGFDVLIKIKEDQSISSIPVIILSNLGQKEDIEKGMKLGAANYFIKAYLTPGEIIEKVKAALK